MTLLSCISQTVCNRGDERNATMTNGDNNGKKKSDTKHYVRIQTTLSLPPVITSCRQVTNLRRNWIFSFNWHIVCVIIELFIHLRMKNKSPCNSRGWGSVTKAAMSICIIPFSKSIGGSLYSQIRSAAHENQGL